MDDRGAALRRRWAGARLLYRTVNDLGLRTIGQVVAHSSRRRRRGPAEWAQRTPKGAPVEPGGLHTVVPSSHGAQFVFSHAELDVTVLADDVVRLTWSPGEEPLPYAAQAPVHWVAPAVSVTEEGAGWVVRGGALALTVSGDGEIRLGRGEGPDLRHELAPRRLSSWWEHRFRARAGERFSGLGEQAGGVDLGGGSFRLWNRDPGGNWGSGRTSLYMGIPVLLGGHPDGDLLSFYDNPSSALVQFPATDGGAEAEVSVRFAGGVLRQYLMVGDLSSLLDRYSQLTGRPALPPRWALGYHQSRWGYRSESDVRGVLDGFGAMGIPLSAVHLDIDYMDGYRVFTVDRRRFPHMGALAERAAAAGARLVTIVDPAVKVDPGYRLFRQGLEEHVFCTAPDGRPEIGVVWPGRAAFPDFTSAQTRRWWAGHYRFLLDQGVGGVWHDMNEPTSISLAGDPTLPLSTRHDVEGRGGDHARVHNLYGLLMNEAGHTGLRAARPERRPFVLSRSGWAGNQRWAWNWTGDVESSWAGLRQQVATVIGLGLSGIPFSGSDIGGFTGVPGPELYLRWLQMSVFMALCRTHSVVGVPRREPWRFPEPARGAIAAWIRLRYRLLPYLYTLAHQASESGAPLVRPLWWPATSTDLPASDDADDTFLLGDALLVAPVTGPGSTGRRVSLPAGRWRRWWKDDQAGDHGGVVVARTPLARIPVFVRAGSVVVLDDAWGDPRSPCALEGDELLSPAPPPALGLGHVPQLFAVHCWPLGGSAEGAAFDDAGDGDGPIRRDGFSLTGAVAGETAVLRWQRSGAFPPPPRLRVVLHGQCAARATADGRPVEVRAGAVVCGPFEELRFDGLEPA